MRAGRKAHFGQSDDQSLQPFAWAASLCDLIRGVLSISGMIELIAHRK
jgi:hypothetical protein